MKENIRAFSNLEKFEIRRCSKLMGGLLKWKQSLVKVRVSKCPKLVWTSSGTCIFIFVKHTTEII